jgi:hypothetical protein
LQNLGQIVSRERELLFPRHCERSNPASFVAAKKAGLLRRCRSSQ